MDDSYAFRFSLYPNDLMQLAVGQESIFGYFGGINTNDAGVKYFPPDQRGVDQLRKKGVSNATVFQKLHVDILGNIFPAPPEKRRGLA